MSWQSKPGDPPTAVDAFMTIRKLVLRDGEEMLLPEVVVDRVQEALQRPELTCEVCRNRVHVHDVQVCKIGKPGGGKRLWHDYDDDANKVRPEWCPVVCQAAFERTLDDVNASVQPVYGCTPYEPIDLDAKMQEGLKRAKQIEDDDDARWRASVGLSPSRVSAFDKLVMDAGRVLPEHLPVWKSEPLTKGDAFVLSDWETLTVLDFLDEPNTGLCRVDVRGYEFIVPTVLVKMARDWLAAPAVSEVAAETGSLRRDNAMLRGLLRNIEATIQGIPAGALQAHYRDGYEAGKAAWRENVEDLRDEG